MNTLFRLLRDRLADLSQNEGSFARHNNVQVRIIGNRQFIPTDILTELEDIEKKTAGNKSNRVLNVCFPYTSRDEIVHLMQSVVANACSENGGGTSSISLQQLHDNFYFGAKVPPLDLLIRTSGHRRLSDFMLWQCNHNCTIEFTNVLWPDFKTWPFLFIVFKWSYYQTVIAAAAKLLCTQYKKNLENEQVLPEYSSLPPPPRALTVTGK